MDTWSILISIIAAIVLFTQSLESFSNNLKEQANDKMQSAIKRFTGSKLKGLFTGFIGTGIIKSSSAVVAITVSFVDSGVITVLILPFTKQFGRLIEKRLIKG